MFYKVRMDWDYAIESNSERLLGAVLALFTLIGLVEGGMVERLSLPLYRKVLGRVKAAEAAVRRLIIVAARNIVVEPRPKRPAPKRAVRSSNGKFQGSEKSKAQGESKSRPPSFQLCDPQTRSDAGRPHRRRRRKGPEPRIRILGSDPLIPESIWPRTPAPTPAPQQAAIVKDFTVSAKRLCRRLFAIVHALRNMEREAKRYAAWLAKPKEERRPRRERALRYGLPPGWCSRPKHEVHEILKTCHWLFHELPAPDTS